MRNNITSFVSIISLLLLASCIKDTAFRTYTYTMYKPVYKTSDEVRANVKSAPATNITSSGKMYISGNYIFLAENGKGVHVINNSDPSHPINESYITIPGCTDIAAIGTTLYADCYTDLLTIDISNPKDLKLKTYTTNLFPERQYVLGYMMDSGKVIADWIIKDTTIREKIELNTFYGGVFYADAMMNPSAFNTSSGSLASTQKSAGGSMARFAITSNYLYTVTPSSLHAISISNPQQPQWQKTVSLGWNIETIYPFKDKLFIGSSDGMHIVSISNPSNPQPAGIFTHARVCDPVIADDKYAYVTLRSGTQCEGFTNQMDVVNVSNINAPSLLKSYPLSNPRGLSKDGSILFVCEGANNVKIFNATNPSAIVETQSMAIPESFDVICFNGLAIITAKDGIYQYNYNNQGKATLLSKIGIVK